MGRALQGSVTGALLKRRECAEPRGHEGEVRTSALSIKAWGGIRQEKGAALWGCAFKMWSYMSDPLLSSSSTPRPEQLKK